MHSAVFTNTALCIVIFGAPKLVGEFWGLFCMPQIGGRILGIILYAPNWRANLGDYFVCGGRTLGIILYAPNWRANLGDYFVCPKLEGEPCGVFFLRQIGGRILRVFFLAPNWRANLAGFFSCTKLEGES